jgi:NitT/TauT family transport system substrate-binding protein
MPARQTAGWTRQAFLRGSSLAGTAALLGYRPRSAAAEPPLETTRIRLVQTPSMCSAPQYVAEELLRAEGFTEVVYLEREGPHAVAEALASGAVDISMQFSARLIVQLDRDEPITILAGVHPGCFEVLTAQPLRTLRDLKGKTLAIRALGGPQHVFLASMAAYVGLDPARDLTWVVNPAAKELFTQGRVDAFLGFPPEPQDLRARQIGHVLIDSNVDRPWSNYFCCMAAAHRPFVQQHPVATKRALRAILKATDMCAEEPDRASRLLVDRGRTPREDLVRQVLREISYRQWRDYDPEDTVRFYALRLHEVGMIQSDPQKVIAEGTDWRFLNEIKLELKV